MFTPKQRMLNAYRNMPSDVTPVAPEFWSFYPAKVMGMSLVDFQRNVPFHLGLKTAFEKFKCEGWGSQRPVIINDHIKTSTIFKSIGDGKYRDHQHIIADGQEFDKSYIYSETMPFWDEEYAVKNCEDAPHFFRADFNDDVEFDFSAANKAYEEVGESYLIELSLGMTFFDYFVEIMGFENALFYFLEENEDVLLEMREEYTRFKIRLVRAAAAQTKYESFFIGCNSACNALMGPNLWRQWDKPYLKAITEEVHKQGRMIHNHNHGAIMATVPDLVEIGYDCVCPFERDPGDVNGIEGLEKVRKILADKVTFNGNVHTIKTLINGTPEQVREEVIEIKEAFKGSNRCIIGSGDQVGYDTPEENLWAMIEEGHKQ